MYLVSHGHFWSRDKDGGRNSRSAIAENPMLHANFTALSSIEPELLPIEVLHCRNRDFCFSAHVTLTFIRWPSYTNLIRIPSRCTGWPKMNFRGFRKLSYYIHTYVKTDIRLLNYYHVASRVVITALILLARVSCSTVCWMYDERGISYSTPAV